MEWKLGENFPVSTRKIQFLRLLRMTANYTWALREIFVYEWKLCKWENNNKWNRRGEATTNEDDNYHFIIFPKDTQNRVLVLSRTWRWKWKQQHTEVLTSRSSNDENVMKIKFFLIFLAIFSPVDSRNEVVANFSRNSLHTASLCVFI